MKKLITAISIVFCISLFAACGSTAETTTEVAKETSESNTEADMFLEEGEKTYDIVTSVVTLKYPAKWQDVVQAEVSDDGVKFSTDGTPLFDIMFVETEGGYLLGTYNGTPVYAVVHDDDVTDEQQEMISDINVLVKYLESDPNFTMSN